MDKKTDKKMSDTNGLVKKKTNCGQNRKSLLQ